MQNPINPTWKTEIFPLILVVSTIILSFIFYSALPDQIASHWSFSGEVDGYMSKGLGSFLMPGFLTLIYLMLLFLPLADPKKERYASFRSTYHIFKGSIVTIMSILFLMTSLFNLGYDVKIQYITPALIGFLFIVMGNYMGKIKNNWFMGIRTPWTMSSENVWNRTHHLGGIIFMLFGFVIIISPYLPELIAMFAFVAGILSVVLIPTIYSYILYRAEKK